MHSYIQLMDRCFWNSEISLKISSPLLNVSSNFPCSVCDASR